MDNLRSSYPVIIVGGGPVGLFLAILLRQSNIDCIVLEQRSKPVTHSRSLGIHPVSLELMEHAQLAAPLIRAGIKIRSGSAWNDRKKLGTLSFASCPGPYRFILSLPQFRTERMIADRLRQIAPSCLIRNARVESVRSLENGTEVVVEHRGELKTIGCDFLAGCDGKESRVRSQSGIRFTGGRYPDTYIMGDFEDHTELGPDAAIFLNSRGLIESFPLERDQRRWVVKTERYLNDPDRTALEQRVRRRVGIDLSGVKNTMLSTFGVQHYIAEPMARGRVFLAGDAAHVVSPIGGQGMNLGWLDAWHLHELLLDLNRGSITPSAAAAHYDQVRRNAAKRTIRRAEANMMLGRATDYPIFRDTLVGIMLNTPIERMMARIFTMRGI